MSADFSDEGIAKRLRRLIEARGLSIRQVAKDIQVPYRTLQNQLLGSNKMPASTFARLLEYLQLPAAFITYGRYEPKLRPITDALKKTFGHLLPVVNRDHSLSAPVGEGREDADLDIHAQFIAFRFRDAYERAVVSLSDEKVAIEWSHEAATDEGSQ